MTRNITVAISLLAISGCESLEQVSDSFRDATPRERYLGSLEMAGLADAALARDWSDAGEAALESPVEVTLPFSEETFVMPAEPRAAAYRVTLERGRKLTVSVRTSESDGGEAARVFVDLFRVPENEEDPHRPIESVDSVPWSYEYEPWRGGEFVIRVQPELLRGGYFTVELGQEAQLAFPVGGSDVGSILSFFGDDRDAGRRRHHGVDIFARRGTPVLAASAGETYGVRETDIGGKVVWVRDSVRQARVYYAHLDGWAVGNDEWVEPGDTLGFVGNSGNARTTPPHLHFGLYRRGRGPDRGPTDPMPFLARPSGEVEAQPDRTLLGGWGRITTDGINLRATPSGPVVGTAEANEIARVLAGAADRGRSSYLIELGTGLRGYLAEDFLELGTEATAPVPVAGGSG
ncbi:MAG: M23 family metallopeptidase [Gemmatimonadetes bacterium]|nr:M23 family metallopeptidase [Gemmatimonadota bacterium]